MKINIPQRLHNAIIGPKGRLIQSIMDECGGVRVHFPPSGSSNDEVRISGPQEDVERAKKMILEMANETVESGGGATVIRAIVCLWRLPIPCK